MRISVIEGDVAYKHPSTCLTTFVYLDGKLVTGCVTADEELGEAVVVKTLNGIIQHDGVDVLYETLKGKVEIKIL